MKTKFILTDKQSGTTYKFKTLKDVAESLGIEYHQIRGLYIFYTKGKKHIFPITKTLAERYELKDDPDYLNVFKDNT